MKPSIWVAALVLAAGCVSELQRVACNATSECTGALQCVDGFCVGEPGGDSGAGGGAASAPTVTETSPASGATDVGVGTILSITFSRAMDTASVSLAPTPAFDLGTVEWNDERTVLVATPAAPLKPSQGYAVALSGRAQNQASLAAGTQFTFTTSAPADTQAPTLVSTTPTGGAANVSVKVALVLSFSEAINPDSIALRLQPTYEAGAATLSADGRTATFGAAPEPLAANTTYAASVEAADLAGNALSGLKSFSFTTGAPSVADTTPPTVLATTPSAGATGVSVNVLPAFAFSEPMDPVATRAAAQLAPPPPGGCAFTWDPSNALLTCGHVAPLAASTSYTLTLGAGARDVAGNPVADGGVAITFTTGAVPDTTAPTIVAVTPANQEQAADPEALVRVEFSEPMDKLSAQQAIGFSSPAGITGSFTWDATGKTVSFRPAAALAGNTTHQWQVSTAAKDLAGNALAMTRLISFKTWRPSAAFDVFAAPDDGYLSGLPDGGSLSAPSTTGTLVYAGDSVANLTYRSFLTFPFTPPANARDVLSATLTLNQLGVSGAPFAASPATNLGRAEVEWVDYALPLTSANALAAWSARAKCPTARACLVFGGTGLSLSTGPAPGLRSRDVTYPASRSLSGGALQLRLVFERNTDGDGVSDYAYFGSANNATVANRPKLTVVYAIP